jgi:hypothetical protein
MVAMSTPGGWEPIKSPRRRAGADAFHLSPFARLARAHVMMAAGDALLTIALANSLFFDLDPNDARWRVFLYLALTMAPLAIVTPFIGPALDRSLGGRRWMIVAVATGRTLVCLIMVNDLHSLLLFPEAFAMVSLGKAYTVARSAVVPTVVRSDAELVEANSKLQLLSGLAVPVAAVPAGVAFAIAGSPGVLVVAVALYGAATLASLRIPATLVAAAPVSAVETAELRGAGVVLAASAMGIVRGIVGFLTFLLLFELRDGATWKIGAVIGLSGLGALIGSMVAPALRRSLSEERMLMMALSVSLVGGVAAAWTGGLAASMLLAGLVAVMSTSARLAFDSLVQRDAPDANRGRSFAKFELRFQIAWVIGAVVPVLISIPLTAGFWIVGALAGFALFSYAAGQQAAHRAHGSGRPVDGAPVDTTAVDWTGVDPKPVDRGLN